MKVFTKLLEKLLRMNYRKEQMVMNICFRMFLIIMLSVAGIASIAAEGDEAAIRAEVDSAVTALNEAYGANDLERYFSFFADDVILVESNGREQTKAGYCAEWKGLIGAGGGVAAIDVNFPRSIRLSADANTAVVHQLSFPVSYRFLDSSDTGGLVNTTIVWAITDVWSKIDGTWKVVHSHFHAPTSNGDDE